MMRYVCKYAPAELFAGFGEETALYNPMPDNLDVADELTHRNVCSFSRALIAGQVANAAEVLVLTDCCDSIRRAADVFRSLGQAPAMLFLPRRQDECARALYRGELLRLLRELERQTGKAFDTAAFRTAFSRTEPAAGPHVAVMGARMGDSLLEEIRKILLMII
jgi:benzoyl-CoA reductase/2-hydroxyglutaryl-CoA dehydratase subunit BcrC/BadD/HgdB